MLGSYKDTTKLSKNVQYKTEVSKNTTSKTTLQMDTVVELATCGYHQKMKWSNGDVHNYSEVYACAH